jgi:hypothetical protein
MKIPINDDIITFLIGMFVGALIILGVAIMMDMYTPQIDITTNVTSTSMNHDGIHVLHTEAGNFMYSSGSSSDSKYIDYISITSIPKCKPVILHVKNGYVKSYIEVDGHQKNC